MPKLYDELASWWTVMSPPDDYTEEAAFYTAMLREASAGPLRTLLELGSGGGSNASHMKEHFDLVLVEPSAGMRAVSKMLNPECEHVEGDMRTVRLGRQFDGVFVHDAVCYMTTEADLRQTIETAFVHCRPGGVALFAPDAVRETFKPSSSHGGRDEGMRGLRYVEWSWDPNPADTTYVVDYAFLLREPDGTVRVEYDRHVEGLFSREDWLRFLREGGFEARAVLSDHSELEPGSYVIFVAQRPLD